MSKKRDVGVSLLKMFEKMQQEYPDLSPDRILIIDADILKDIVTPARIELMKLIRERNPESVGELAALSKRPQESVSRDLTILNNYGILDFVQTRTTKKPTIDRDILVVPSY